MIGTRLSHYLIEEQIGEGGMGVVYKARDTRLLRHVAIKILPAHLVSHDRNRERLVQEARAASALNHPNICTVHDIGEANGVHFIVMELLEGQTLREILEARGRLPEDEVIEMAAKVCDALTAAHSKGIIHRDIKPDNIMVTREGVVKVMDFGLAKLLDEEDGQLKPSATDSLLLSKDLLKTSVSTFQGTATYMSPEQIEKRRIDGRTDVFSVGVLLYELLTGTPPFAGRDSVAVMKAILKDEPKPVTERVPGISPEVDAAVMKALVKRPTERHASASAFREVLQKSPIVLSQKQGQRKRIGVPLILGTFLLLVALFLAIFNNKDPSSDLKTGQTTRLFSNARTIPVATWPGFEDHPSISPEGKKIAFAADRTGSMDIWIMNLEDGSTWNLTPDSPARDEWPQWSPSGKRIVFQSSRDGGRIFVADLSLRTLNLVAEDGRHPAWSPDGQQIVYAEGPDSKNLFTVNLSGGVPTLVYHSEGADYVHSPSWSHDGRWIAFALGTQMTWNIYVVEATGERGFFATHDEYYNLFPNWDKDDGGMFFRSDRGGNWDIWFRQVSLQDMQPIQEAVPITFGAEVQSLQVSRDGERIAYSKVTRQDNLFAVDLKDPQHPIRRVTNWGRITVDPSISPDGTKIVATSNHQGNLDLWMCNRDGSDAKVIYRAKDASESPTWSPDGKRILFVDGDASKMEIKILDLETRNVTQLTHNDYQDIKPAWSPDGKWIAYTRKHPESNIWIISSNGRQARQLTYGIADDTSPRFSPDGKTIAFTSRQDGYENLWIIPFESGTSKQLSFNKGGGGLGVCWSPDGKYIYYAPMHRGVRNIWKVSPDGKVREQVTHFTSSTTHVRRYTSISTDGKELFFATLERVGDVWLMEGR